jgi:hypothetical protein
VKEPALALLVLLLVLGGVMTASAWNTAQEARQRLAIGAAQGARNRGDLSANARKAGDFEDSREGRRQSRERPNPRQLEGEGKRRLGRARGDPHGNQRRDGPENHIRNAYGIEPGSKSSDVRGTAVSSLTRIRDWYDVLLRHPELHGKFSIETLKATSMEIEWTMELEDSSAFEVLAKDFRELPGKPKVESGNRPVRWARSVVSKAASSRAPKVEFRPWADSDESRGGRRRGGAGAETEASSSSRGRSSR